MDPNASPFLLIPLRLQTFCEAYLGYIEPKSLSPKETFAILVYVLILQDDEQ